MHFPSPGVLIVTRRDDVSADHVEDAIAKRGGCPYRVDTADFPQRLQLGVELAESGWRGGLVSCSAGRVSLGDLASVYVRRPGPFQFSSSLTPAERRHAGHEARYGLGGVLMSLAVRWCNHPGKSADAAYKPTQLAAFRDCGLRVPRTLITNRADDVRSFVKRVGHVVCKAIVSEVVRTTDGSQVVYTHLLSNDDLADLRGVHHTAHLFQEYVPKAFEVRLTVVGNEFFAAKIDTGSATSTQVDWRRDYDSHVYDVIDTPAEIRSAVTAYLTNAGLAFGAFDFVVTPDHEWVALECNPEGQWGWIEENTGLPIADAIARYLLQRTE
ncbi:MAG: ATP-grasp ribosomal peptide maturase [Pseudonocardiales bacterium]|nr:ATP-grasp ribosomal peptide maturase [Pseudonocardiales bacterium]